MINSSSINMVIYIISIILFGINSLFIKTINIDFIYKIFYNSLILSIMSFLFIKYFNPDFSFIINFQNVKLSLLYFLQTVLVFTTFIILPISIALPFNLGSSIIFIDIIEYINDNNKINYNVWISNVFILISLFIISYSKINKKYKYIKYGIICSVLYALFDAYNMKKEKEDKNSKALNNKNNLLNESIKSNEIIYELNFISTIFLLFICIIIKLFNIKNIPFFYNNNSNYNNIFKFILIQIFINYIGYILMYYSLNNMNISIWMTLLSLDIIIGLIIGYIFLNESINFNKIIGCILLILSIIYKSKSIH